MTGRSTVPYLPHQVLNYVSPDTISSHFRSDFAMPTRSRLEFRAAEIGCSYGGDHDRDASAMR
jgi:hypothetical protein